MGKGWVGEGESVRLNRAGMFGLGDFCSEIGLKKVFCMVLSKFTHVNLLSTIHHIDL